MELRNPITAQVFETQEEFVESLVESYKKLKVKAYQLGQEELELLTVINELAGHPEIVKGRIELQGTKQVLRVNRGINVKYDKPRGAEHPLRKLMEQFRELADMVSVEYKEKGSVIQKLMDRMAAGEVKDPDEKELAEALAAVRVENPAKVSIELKDRLDVKGVEGDDD